MSNKELGVCISFYDYDTIYRHDKSCFEGNKKQKKNKQKTAPCKIGALGAYVDLKDPDQLSAQYGLSRDWGILLYSSVPNNSVSR